jgi:hypothetical protein
MAEPNSYFLEGLKDAFIPIHPPLDSATFSREHTQYPIPENAIKHVIIAAIMEVFKLAS